ncbi:MAG: hypothetical protein E2O67_05900 [Deltaproteobacteria bacterium]|nr:MAG: hypothetical protein E2O67_05900 [Deltaproteobacteria bacterium]
MSNNKITGKARPHFRTRDFHNAGRISTQTKGQKSILFLRPLIRGGKNKIAALTLEVASSVSFQHLKKTS